jgi:hypothetical protein
MSDSVVYDGEAVIIFRGPTLRAVGPHCYQEIWDDGRKGNLKYV